MKTLDVLPRELRPILEREEKSYPATTDYPREKCVQAATLCAVPTPAEVAECDYRAECRRNCLRTIAWLAVGRWG